MQDMLKDKVALITGATSGMGKAIAKLFASEGAKVIIGGRNQNKAKAIIADIEAAGGEAVTFGPMDVTSKESIQATVDAIMEKYGRIDILAAFAGGAFDGDMVEVVPAPAGAHGGKGDRKSVV